MRTTVRHALPGVLALALVWQIPSAMADPGGGGGGGASASAGIVSPRAVLLLLPPPQVDDDGSPGAPGERDCIVVLRVIRKMLALSYSLTRIGETLDPGAALAGAGLVMRLASLSRAK